MTYDESMADIQGVIDSRARKLQEQTERADKWLDRTMQRTGELAEALDVLAHIVSQANVNPVVNEADDNTIVRYDMPVGSIHKAIPFLARFSVVVDQYGAIHKGANCPVVPKPDDEGNCWECGEGWSAEHECGRADTDE